MMSVSSAPPKHRIEVGKVHRDDYVQLKQTWDESVNAISHSRAPSCVVGAEEFRNIQLFKLFDETENLVAYFAFQEAKFLGIRIIRPAYYELTLDFIDISAVPSWGEYAPAIFWNWITSQKKCVTDIFMCSEKSLLASQAQINSNLHLDKRGKYFYLDLPVTFEEFVNGLSRPVRRDTRKIFRSYQDTMIFELVRGNALGDELQQAIEDFMYLHKEIFPFTSAMLPHREELARYIEKSFTDGTVFFARAREMTTGHIVATNLFAESHGILGLIQNGRRVESEYDKLGSWLLGKTIEWAIENKLHRLEFLFGDQEYKRRLASGVDDAVSITYFSSQRARYTFRICQRLGRYVKSLR